ncbi:MAG: peptide deformylase [Bacteroidales bacterium]|nr:peptide deformylase [Bacteroidales bacterium]
MSRKTAILLSAACLAVMSIIFVMNMKESGQTQVPSDLTAEEIRIIHSSDSLLRVLTIDDSLDLKVLRAQSTDLSEAALRSEDYARLAKLMIATVSHPSQDGVGIAGPQVGLNRRVVAVQRFDRPGEPFEVYPNIRIVHASDSLALGPEGCLSVPDRRGDVLRSQEIVIEYTSTARGSEEGSLQTVRDTVRGFTAVIFQHEIDHLDGILYIDRL